MYLGIAEDKAKQATEGRSYRGLACDHREPDDPPVVIQRLDHGLEITGFCCRRG